jgi:lambda repressor-like predicted transcriptional regulator
VRARTLGADAGAGLREPLGTLADGTAFYAPIGELIISGDRVQCHLCGRLLRSVTAHLRAHGWTKDGYCSAFGLERLQSLEGAATRKRRATAFAARLVFEPAVREGSAAGHARARSGALAQDAATAARGRKLPEQRRRKAKQALASVRPAVVAELNRRRAAEQVAATAADIAQRGGYPRIGDLVRERTAAGASLAAISREAGLHKDWLSRHLPGLDQAAADAAGAAARKLRLASTEARWLSSVRRLGFADVASYLHQRHAVEHRTMNQIATESGVSQHAARSALERHGVAVQLHAAKRAAAQRRRQAVAAAMGCATVAEYVHLRRSAGWTWAAMAAETGQPQTWLRRHCEADRK